MFLTLVYSIPSLWNIGCLLFVIFFVYAVIGMNVFGAIEMNVYDDGIDKHANFQSWENSLLLLYRIGTSDAWGPVYLNCQVQVIIFPFYCSYFLSVKILKKIIVAIFG